MLILEGSSRPVRTSVQRADQAVATAAVIAAAPLLLPSRGLTPGEQQIQLAVNLASAVPVFIARVGTVLLRRPSEELQRVEMLLRHELEQ
jgi:hypothetical protein